MRLCTKVHSRKNWLFSNTPRGAEASCGIYSVVTTARECGLSPMRYVEWLLDELPLAGDLCDPAVADRYLPWSDDVPESCRLKAGRADEYLAAAEDDALYERLLAEFGIGPSDDGAQEG